MSSRVRNQLSPNLAVDPLVITIQSHDGRWQHQAALIDRTSLIRWIAPTHSTDPDQACEDAHTALDEYEDGRLVTCLTLPCLDIHAPEVISPLAMPSNKPIFPLRMDPTLKARAQQHVAQTPGLTLNSLIVGLLTKALDSMPAPKSRADPCPCGSGEKYKHCHGATR